MQPHLIVAWTVLFSLMAGVITLTLSVHGIP